MYVDDNCYISIVMYLINAIYSGCFIFIYINTNIKYIIYIYYFKYCHINFNNNSCNSNGNIIDIFLIVK